jgi:hypothetical protein
MLIISAILTYFRVFGYLFCSFVYNFQSHKMRISALVFCFFIVFTSFGQDPADSNWHYRAGLNLNGLRTRTLELSGQALKKGKFIYNLNIGYTYQSPRNGYQTQAQKNIDSLSADIKTSGFFVKPGVQANVFTIAEKFTKADIFIGAGVTNTWYQRKSTVTRLRETKPKAQKADFKGSSFAPYISVGGNFRLLYSIFLDLGLQYNLSNNGTKDNLLPARYDWLPGQGGNYKNGNKTTLLAVVRWQFDQK